MLRLVSFIVGCGVLHWWELANLIGIMQILLGVLGILVILLVVIGVLNKKKERWIPLLLAAILLLGFSGLVFFSIGWLIAPVALLLLGFFILKLVHLRTVYSAC